ncbi:MAG: TolC family protein [Caulobacter sp.]|nr:TolC family protein [Caulobacter sp.]
MGKALERGGSKILGLLLSVIAATSVHAQTQTQTQTPAGVAKPMSFEEARAQLEQRSDQIAAGRAGARSSRAQADAVARLNLPVVSLDAQALKYQKSVDIPLEPGKEAVGTAADGFIGNLPNLLPAVPGDLMAAIQSGLAGRVQDALALTPNSLDLQTRQTVFRPTATAIMPLYTGGLIPGVQGAARAEAAGAEAQAQATSDLALLKLIQAYFGQQLAARLLAVSIESQGTFQHHLDNARKIEAQGVIPKSQRLQAEVAFDAAQRQALSAADTYQTATETLSLLLREDTPVAPTTPLFVASTPLPPAQTFVDAGLENQPELKRLQALRDASQAGVRVAESALKPKAYAFAEYNFNRDDALIIDPDWILGVGVHYTLFSNLDRGKSVSAAKAKSDQAQAAVGAARNDLRVAIAASWRQVETARKQFLLLDTNITAARENLRVQTIAFDEGEATTSAVIDAQNALSLAETQKAAAAYAYDLALAQLLAASGQIQTYGDHVARADREVR